MKKGVVRPCDPWLEWPLLVTTHFSVNIGPSIVVPSAGFLPNVLVLNLSANRSISKYFPLSSNLSVKKMKIYTVIYKNFRRYNFNTLLYKCRITDFAQYNSADAINNAINSSTVEFRLEYYIRFYITLLH